MSIYYTIDGSTPTINSTLYNGEFNITHDCTIKAIRSEHNKLSQISSFNAVYIVDEDKEYLHFKTINENKLTLRQMYYYAVGNIKLEYSFDKKTWNNWVESNYRRELEIPANSTVYLRGDNDVFNTTTEDDSFRITYQFESTQPIECHGNIMSLLDSTMQLNETKGVGCFHHLFSGMKTLLTTPILTASTLTDSCYYGLFYGCENISEVKIYAKYGNNSCCNQIVNSTNGGTIYCPSTLTLFHLYSGWNRVNLP